MSINIDAILLSLLVGVITSVALLGLAFIFLDTRIRARSLSRLFRFLMYEDEKVETKRLPISGSEGVFAGLLIVAILFGLGVAMESASDALNKPSISLRKIMNISADENIRIKSFLLVAKGEVATGRIGEVSSGKTDKAAGGEADETASGSADNKLSALFTDYVACSMIKDGGDGPCDEVEKRVASLYYTAKNRVFAHETYFRELDKLQSRIDFMRSLSYALVLLALVLMIGATLAFMAELADFLVRRRLAGARFSRYWLRATAKETYVSHIKNLAGLRLLVVSLTVFLLGYGALKVWSDIEFGYDNRVFGYFLCKSCMQADGAGTDPAEDIPVSPYHVFSAKTLRFEPSAATGLGVRDGKLLFLLANDKEDDNLLVFALSPSGNLEESGSITISGLRPGATLKIEALASVDEPTGMHMYMAGTEVYENRSTSVLYEGGLDPTGLGLDTPQARSIAFRPVVFPGDETLCGVLDWLTCEIEGLAVDPKRPRTLIVGVRRIAEDDRGLLPQVALARLDLGASKTLERIRNVTVPSDHVMRCQGSEAYGIGISDLAFDDKGGLLILTSFEQDANCQRKKEKDDKGYASSDVRGALWRVPSFSSIQRDAPILPRFVLATAHKPEGLAFIEPGSDTVLIVYDDDASRKGVDRAPDTFPLRQNESVFTIQKLPLD